MADEGSEAPQLGEALHVAIVESSPCWSMFGTSWCCTARPTALQCLYSQATSCLCARAAGPHCLLTLLPAG